MTEEEAIYHQFIEWLKGIHDERFFANIHFNTPHADYDPPPDYDIFTKNKSVHVLRNQPGYKDKLTESQTERLLSLYYGEIRYVDSVIGKLIKALHKAGLMKKTVIVITADHGEEFYDHKSWSHAHTLYNELLHVPMIFYVPDHSGAPSRIKNHVSIIDIGPTLLSLVGLPQDPFMDGKDLTPFFRGSREEIHDFIFAECLSPKANISKFAIIRDGFKLIEYNYPSEKMEALFDIQRDLGEKKRLPIKIFPQYEGLKEKMAAMKRYVASKKIESKTVRLSADKKEQLRELGYIQ